MQKRDNISHDWREKGKLPILTYPVTLDRKCSKISNTFLFLFSKKIGYRGWISQTLVRIANIDDPDQTASSEEV